MSLVGSHAFKTKQDTTPFGQEEAARFAWQMNTLRTRDCARYCRLGGMLICLSVPHIFVQHGSGLHGQRIVCSSGLSYAALETFPYVQHSMKGRKKRSIACLIRRGCSCYLHFAIPRAVSLCFLCGATTLHSFAVSYLHDVV